MPEKNFNISLPRTLVVGDVHGCLNELLELLHRARYETAYDRLIFVGDLINKGPDSFEVLQFVRGLSEKSVTVVQGNHESGFLRYCQEGDYASPQFRELKQAMAGELEQWCAWISQRPLYYETDDFMVVHAGLAPHLHPSKTSARILMNIRTWDGIGRELGNEKHPSWYDLYHEEKLVVFGHWAKRGLVIRDNVVGLDSGCVYGRYLTLLELPRRQILQVPAKAVYEKILGVR